MPSMSAGSCSSFQQFFDRWLAEQEQFLEVLTSAAAQPDSARLLSGRVMEHYEKYYRVKREWAGQDVLAMLSPSWTSSLEDAFLWIGGWRPSTAFHLLYSKSGLQFNSFSSQIHDLLLTLTSPDLAGLSAAQFHRLDELQRRTISEEKAIAEKMAKVQESVADGSMVELSHAVTQMMQGEGERDGDRVGAGLVNDRVEMALMPKEIKMGEILQMADELRISTLRSIVVDVLNPIQAVHFLIAVAELHLRVHEWGKRRDAATLGRAPPSST